MSFRKRNVVIRAPEASLTSQSDSKDPLLGTRPSPLDGRMTTSTGTASLDQLLAGHGGLPLGQSLLIEESGTTDFGGVMIRYFAAEGLVQGHQVHVLGVGDYWRRELPGLVETKEQTPQVSDSASTAKMKIAWRYERLGIDSNKKDIDTRSHGGLPNPSNTFCHSFDLSKKLEASCIRGQLLTYPLREPTCLATQSFFSDFITKLRSKLKAASSLVHRVIVPGLLSPALYPADACRPEDVLRFLHGLQSLLRQFPTRLTAFVSLPTSLYPRHTGLCKWMEHLFDGVIELVPLQQPKCIGQSLAEGNKAQGLVRIHSMPIYHERGGGVEGCWKREDMAFRLSASHGLVIIPFSLPPVGLEDQPGVTSKPEQSKAQDLEF